MERELRVPRDQGSDRFFRPRDEILDEVGEGEESRCQPVEADGQPEHGQNWVLKRRVGGQNSIMRFLEESSHPYTPDGECTIGLCEYDMWLFVGTVESITPLTLRSTRLEVTRL